MPLPDLARPSKVEAKLMMHAPTTTTLATVLTCPADTTLRLRTTYVANQTGAVQVFSLNIVRGGTAFLMHSGVSVPAKTLFNATTVDDAVYLEPGDSVTFSQTAITAALTLFMSYEVVRF